MSVAKPVLRIFDIEKAIEFYIKWLDFTVDWEHRFGDDFPLYMQISKNDIILHLSEHHGDACPGAKVFISYSEDIVSLYNLLITKGYKYNSPGLENASWGGKCFEVIDPFGNRLLFSEAG